MEMVFWFGGILGALLFVLGLLLLLQRRRGALTLTLVGLVMAALLIPALGLYRDTQAYLYTGIAGVVLFVLGLMLFSRGRWGVALLGIGLVAALYLFPAFKVTEPWNTNAIELVNKLTAPQPTSTAETPSTTEPTAPSDTTTTEPPTQPSTDTTTPSDTTQPDSSNAAPTEPTTEQPSATTPQPSTETPSTTTPSTTPTEPTTTAPTPDTTQTPIGATSSDVLCPCILRVSTGISSATVEVTRQGGEPLRQMGAVVDFTNLEVGDYVVSVQAPGYVPYNTPLNLTNNKSLTVYLLKQ